MSVAFIINHGMTQTRKTQIYAQNTNTQKHEHTKHKPQAHKKHYIGKFIMQGDINQSLFVTAANNPHVVTVTVRISKNKDKRGNIKGFQ